MASDRVPELLSALEQAVALLQASGEARWADWLEKDRNLIRGEDFYGIEHLLQAFGGVGSFSDVVLQPASKNAELKWVMERIYEIANGLRRERHRA